MESMSHDPVVGDIGSQLVDIAMQGLDSGAAALMQLTSLIPAGSEEVSMQAAMAFAAEGAQMLASNTAAQQELPQTGTALVNIAKMYSQVDDTAADTLAFGAAGPLSRLSGQPLAGGPVGAGLMRAEALPGAAGTAARTPLMAQLIDNPALGGTSGTIGTTAPAVANAASSGARRRYCPIELVGHRGISGRQLQGRAGVVGR
jgi:hypothetical protein